MPRRTEFQLPQLTLRQLLRLTPADVREKAKSCRVVSRNYGTGSREGFRRSRSRYPTWYNEMRTYTICTKKRHSSYVRFYGPPEPNTRCWVWCDCGYFGYYLEWTLAQYGSSSLETGYQSQGPRIKNQPPRIRNPKQKPYLCKHLLLAAEQGLRQTRDLAAQKGQEASEASAPQTTKKPALHIPDDMQVIR